jgi:hypothetical protein
VLSLGDFITQGKVEGDSIKELSYRYWLWEKLDPAPMNEKKKNLETLKQSNKELKQALKEANLMILATHTMIEVAEKDLKISI